MADIFISYTKTDQQSAALVSVAFESHGYSVFYDVDLVPGDSWDRRIEAELGSARTVVVLWSPASVDRQWVRNEARDGLRRGTLCPAMIDACDIPVEFSHVQAADLRNFVPNDSHAGWTQLRAAVDAKFASRPSVSAPAAPAMAGRLQLSADLAEQLRRALADAEVSHARYDTAKLHPEIRAVVNESRRVMRAAITAQHMAMQAAEIGEDSRSRAYKKEPGYGWRDFENENFRGRMIGDKIGDFGVLDATGGRCAGERYAGQFARERPEGHGMMVYTLNENNALRLRYAGEFLGGYRNGLGVMFLTNWCEYTTYFDSLATGPSVLVWNDGGRYEGEMRFQERLGRGVLWNELGEVIAQGVWNDNKLTASFG
jgi:TIR domain